jgi:anti-repressor protein
MREYGFSDTVDFYSILSNTSEAGGRPATDHQLTIEMAKELCMLQRNEKGKQARKYFIELEKAWNTPERVMARALRLAEAKINEMKLINNTLRAEAQKNKPKVLFADAVSASGNCVLIGELAKILRGNGVEIGQNRLYEWLR